jgi:hypothetical protein
VGGPRAGSERYLQIVESRREGAQVRPKARHGGRL